MDPLQGAGFKIYLLKDLSPVKEGTIVADENGNYNMVDFKRIDYTKEQTALDFSGNANGERIPELFSDENGFLMSPEIPYGKYIVIESTVPEGYQAIEPFIVDINEDSRTPKKMMYLIDKEFQARIKIVKKDDTTGKTVLKESASYRIWDITKNKYVEQWTAYPNKIQYGTENNPYRTTEEGYLLTPEKLGKGEYELREVQAPKGYVITGKEENPKPNVRFKVTTNMVYELDPDLGAENAVIVVEQRNTPQVGTITVSKQAEFLSNSQKQDDGYQFGYEQRPVTDAKFAIYAKEDVYTQDNQTDEKGERTKIYVKNQFVKEVETNEKGEAVFEKLPLGKYVIIETKAGEGITADEEPREVELTYEGQDKAIIYRNIEYTTPRPKININVHKKDADTGESIAGVTVGLYAAEDIIGYDKTLLVPKDTLLEKAITNQEGYAQFTTNLPKSKYYVLEIKPAAGYLNNHERLEMDATTISSNKETQINTELKNKKTQIHVEKIEKTENIEQRIPIIGAKLQVLDPIGNIVQEWITDNNPHVIRGLEIGKPYILKEIQPANGYVTTEDIPFTIQSDGSLNVDESDTIEETEIPTIIMQDDITRIKVAILDKETREPIKGITVQIVNKDTGEIVNEFIADGEEHMIEKIPIGNYQIVEKGLLNGYVSTDNKDFIVEDTVTIQSKVIEQDHTRLDIKLIDEVTKDLLPGAKLEIRNDKGEVVGTIDNTGTHYYVERLPIGQYTIVGLEIPEGYEAIKEFKFTLEDKPDVQYVVIESKRLPFDLKVEKYASEISVNGIKQIGTNQAGEVVKIDINGKDMSVQDIEIIYTIKIINAGQVAGSVGKIVDQIPSGLKFNASKNETYWKEEGKNIVTTAFADRKLQPGEIIELKMTLDWTKNEFNLGEKVNVVMLEEVSSSVGFAEVDAGNNSSTSSTQGNIKKVGFVEKDISNNSSNSKIILSLKTGKEIVLMRQISFIVLLELLVITMVVLIEIKLFRKQQR